MLVLAQAGLKPALTHIPTVGDTQMWAGNGGETLRRFELREEGQLDQQGQNGRAEAEHRETEDGELFVDS